MNIGIIGSGRIGSTVGRLWIQAGHHVLFSFSRQPEKLLALAASIGQNVRIGTPSDAANFGDVVFFAPPWWVMEDALQAAGSLEGKILIDATNPYKEGWIPLTLDAGTTSGEEIARRAPGARVVNAYNTLTAATLATESRLTSTEERFALIYCSDDVEAKAIVAGLIADSGFEPVDVGPLRNGHYQDPGGPLHNALLHAAQVQAILNRAQITK